MSDDAKKDISDALKQLGDNLVSKNCIVRVGDRVAIFCAEIGGWNWLESNTAMNYLSIMLGLVSSVNYEMSTRPARKYLKELNLTKCSFGTTVCFRNRYDVVDQGTFYELIRCNLFDSDENDKNCDESVSILGMMCPYHPQEISKLRVNGGMGKIDVWLRRTFGESLSTIKWLLGNCIIEPKSQDYVVMITGPSMSGKTTALNIISSVFENRTAVIDPDLIVGSRNLTYSDVAVCESSRICITGRLDFDASVGINTKNLKELTGGGPVHGLNGEKITLSQTLLATSNYLPKLESNKDWCRPEITRRFITVETLDRISYHGAMHERVPDFSDEERGYFVAECIASKLGSKYIPIKLECILASLFLGNFAEVSKYFGKSCRFDENESYQATKYLSNFSKMRHDILMRCAEGISRDSVGIVKGRKYLKGLGMLAYAGNEPFPSRDSGESYNVVWRNASQQRGPEEDEVTRVTSYGSYGSYDKSQDNYVGSHGKVLKW